MRSCDYSGVAVAEVWVGEQEVAVAVVVAAPAAAVAAAGQYKEEGPGQTGMRGPGYTLLGHLAPYLSQRRDPSIVVSTGHVHIPPRNQFQGSTFSLLFLPPIPLCPLLHSLGVSPEK